MRFLGIDGEELEELCWAEALVCDVLEARQPRGKGIGPKPSPRLWIEQRLSQSRDQLIHGARTLSRRRSQ